jgi:TPR repeat protein
MLTVETPTDNLSELTAMQDLTEMQEALINVECEKAKALLCKALRFDLGSSMDYEAIDQAVAEGFDEVKAKLILNLTSKVLYRGGLLSLVSDDAKAAECFLMAAKQGYAKAQFNLGLLYESGEGVPEDAAEAFKWFCMAAEQGHVRAQEKCDELLNTGKVFVSPGING